MFNRSDTLREINRLICVSDSDYTYLDVTILNIRLLVSKKIRKDLTRLGKELRVSEAHKVFEEVLLLKKLNIILAL